MRDRIREIIRQTCDEMGVHIVRGVLARDHVDPAEIVSVAGDAAHQGALVAPYPDGVSRVAQALLGQAVLGAGVFLDNIGECDRRDHHAVPGITFQTGCYRPQPVVVHSQEVCHRVFWTIINQLLNGIEFTHISSPIH